ncbi:MAG TPA: Dyp-type peroxidase [Longimicrobium sp.]|nr:Dyp-type peroxidase [Longimicrobium sp.]
MSPRVATSVLLAAPDAFRQPAIYPPPLPEPGAGVLARTVPLAEAERMTAVQGNILFPHGRRCGLHLFLRFPARDEARRWLAALGREAVRSLPAEIEARRRREAGEAAGPFAGIALSAAGYDALGLEPPADAAFRKGMKRAWLNDRPEREWDDGYRADVHAVLTLADDDWAALVELAARWRPSAGIQVVAEERGEELPGEREHFGFRDNISQPLFIDEDVDRARRNGGGGRMWDPATPLGVVLAPDPHAPGEFGSYLAYRKLEQDVAAFDAGIREMAEALGVDEAMAGALVIGRFKDGTPLTLADRPGLGPANDFDYTAGRGERCPFSSHVRRSNPRGELDHVSETDDLVNRIARRSLPYGRPGDSPVGMLFFCFQSDIGRQFELIQNNWLNYPHFPRVQVGPDPIAGQRNSWDPTPGQRWDTTWGGGIGPVKFRFAECVRCRGGEYFFAPSLTFLHTLEAE